MKLRRIYHEIVDPIKFWIWDRQMGERRSENELWIWEDVLQVEGKWSKPIRAVNRPKNWSQLLVSVGLAESNSDAQRLLKSNSIEVRSWWLDNGWGKIDLKSEIPDFPFLIRKGKAFFGIKLIWLPVEGVSQKFGELTLRDGGYN